MMRKIILNPEKEVENQSRGIVYLGLLAIPRTWYEK